MSGSLDLNLLVPNHRNDGQLDRPVVGCNKRKLLLVSWFVERLEDVAKQLKNKNIFLINRLVALYNPKSERLGWATGRLHSDQ